MGPFKNVGILLSNLLIHLVKIIIIIIFLSVCYLLDVLQGARVCGGASISCPLQDPSSGTKNQIDMRQINKRKSYFVAYIWGTHTDMEIPETGKMRYIYVILN